MRTFLFVVFALVVLTSHDMFLRLDDYFLAPDTQATILLYNGTFDRSDNVIDRDRMQDVSLVTGGKRTAVDTSNWSERDSTTVLSFTTGEAGTYVVGVSTRARSIAMAAEDFNDYLAHDGVVDMLKARERKGVLETDAVERYSKHVKTIFQVGELRTDDWRTPLDYPIEFVPQVNPYELHVGDTLPVRLYLAGAPLADQLVLIGNDHDHAHPHDEGADHQHTGTEMRTDGAGTLQVPITSGGTWHLRTIHMVEVEEEGLTHESNWATLTFGVDGHTHGAGADHDHDHAHAADHEHGIPGYVYLIGSLVVVGLLFFFFSRK